MRVGSAQVRALSSGYGWDDLLAGRLIAIAASWRVLLAPTGDIDETIESGVSDPVESDSTGRPLGSADRRLVPPAPRDHAMQVTGRGRVKDCPGALSGKPPVPAHQDTTQMFESDAITPQSTCITITGEFSIVLG